jgi:hypothetical protein
MLVKTSIQNMLKTLDSPVSGSRQAQNRASLVRNYKKVIAIQHPGRSIKLYVRISLKDMHGKKG